MPYRAMLFTLLTMLLALILVTLYARAVSPVLRTATDAITSANMTATNPATAPKHQTRPESYVSLRAVIRLTLILTFVLICFLLLVGFFATSREWIRFITQKRQHQRERTQYVDAWKIAGERMKDDTPPISPTDDD
jgi:hypothetical protein